MASGNKATTARSTTYPDQETLRKTAFTSRKMSTLDCTYRDASTTTAAKEEGARNVSAGGRLRAHQFHQTYSSQSSCSSSCSQSSSSSFSSSSSTSLALGQKMLRFSDECWCSTAAATQEQQQGCLESSPRFRERSASRLSSYRSSVLRVVNWQRHTQERESVSPTIDSQDSGQRHSRSSERRSEKQALPAERRRSQFCPSISLPPSAKLQAEQSSSSSTALVTPPTSASVATECQRRRSQFRRAWSLFSLTCDKEVGRKEKSPQQRILRQPTRRVYKRGVSGLPIECSCNKLGLVY